jgi:hypothetical protein
MTSRERRSQELFEVVVVPVIAFKDWKLSETSTEYPVQSHNSRTTRC